MMAWGSGGPLKALRLWRTAKRLWGLTAHVAQAESNHARMAGSELGFLVQNTTWSDTVRQVKS
jgi:hypothetical protein